MIEICSSVASGLEAMENSCGDLVAEIREGHVSGSDEDPVEMDVTGSDGLINEASLAPSSLTKKDKYQCPLCPKEFQHKSGRYNHIKIHHKVKLDFGKVHCLENGCLFSCTYTTVLQQHLKNAHNIPMNFLNLEFDNYEEFEKWKHDFETGEVCRFVKKSGSRINETGKSMYLYCNRSGTFVSHGQGIRAKKLGTAKISAHCTALIKYFEESSGRVKASVCTTHYGHNKDHRFLRLTKNQKQHIADKMKSGMSRELLLDSLHSTFVNKLDRIHELSKKDLSNIRASYKLPKESQRVKPRQTTGFRIPVDLIKDNWTLDIDTGEDSPILFHKDRDCEHENLNNKDKCLILMTKGQKDLFLKFCNNSVIYVTILRISSSVPVFLTVIFILDDFYETFPVCFMISTNTKLEMLTILFDRVLTVIGPISVRALATDDNELITEAWCKIMGPTKNLITSNRYIDAEWRKNLTMVEDEATQGNKLEIQPHSKKSSTVGCSSKLSVVEERLKRRERWSQPFGAVNHPLIRLLSSFLCLVVLWSLLYTLLKDELLPGGKLLILIILVSLAYTLGDIVKIFGIPKLLGMLLSGILMRNLGFFFETKDHDVYGDLVAVTRQIALTCILISAGFELDAKSMKSQSMVVFELSFIPCIVEALGVAVCSKYFLNFSWPWGLMLGFIMGAVTPAIVVPALIQVQRRGYDEDRKISTIIIAAASFDDIVAISGFGVFFGIIFSEGNVMNKMIRSPIEAALGICVGIVWGMVSAWLPHPSDRHVIAKRVFMVGGGGLMFVLGSGLIGYDGAGPLACIVSAFISGIFWKWQGWSVTHHPVRDVFSSLWILLEPALFALIGVEMDLKAIKLSHINKGILVVGGGLVARSVACTMVLLTADVTWKELIFINIAWIPKATVQAALGSLALDKVKSFTPIDENLRINAELTLMITVLSILFTAPLGAVGINLLASKLLKSKKGCQVASNDLA